jgi:hypothetical protein
LSPRNLQRVSAQGLVLARQQKQSLEYPVMHRFVILNSPVLSRQSHACILGQAEEHQKGRMPSGSLMASMPDAGAGRSLRTPSFDARQLPQNPAGQSQLSHQARGES